MKSEPALQALVQYYENLSPASLDELDRFYAPQARFRDPFNSVQGLDAIRRIFSHMFATLDQPRFVVTRRVQQGTQAFLVWEFHFGTRGAGARTMIIHGATHLELADDGLVLLHRDYWDAAQELYEQLPVLGTLMRWLRRKLEAR